MLIGFSICMGEKDKGRLRDLFIIFGGVICIMIGYGIMFSNLGNLNIGVVGVLVAIIGAGMLIRGGLHFFFGKWSFSSFFFSDK